MPQPRPAERQPKRQASHPRQVRERIVDSCFTTKPMGKGTGLGLSISHGLVKEHGGELHFETETGRGTRFPVDLPLPEPKRIVPSETV